MLARIRAAVLNGLARFERSDGGMSDQRSAPNIPPAPGSPPPMLPTGGCQQRAAYPVGVPGYARTIYP